MNTDSVKKSVVNSYSKLARSQKNGLLTNLFACCDTKAQTDMIGQSIGYSPEELRKAPEGSNLGVGCGNPSEFAKIKAGETVIDLGSGAGFDAFIVACIVGQGGKVIGVDLSDEMLNLANANAKKGNYSNVEFIKGDIESLPLGNDLADHVISNCVINLSQRKDNVYAEAFRVMKKGGSLSISDIVLKKELPDYIKNSLSGHIACISGAEELDTYVGYIRAAGFEDIKVEKESNFPLELMLADPQLKKIAKEMDFDLNSQEAKELATRVKSVSISAQKPL